MYYHLDKITTYVVGFGTVLCYRVVLIVIVVLQLGGIGRFELNEARRSQYKAIIRP